MRATLLLAGMATLVLVGCAGAGAGSPQEQIPPNVPAVPLSESPGGTTVTGRLGGDAQLEGGCAWVDDGRSRWQVEYPDGWSVSLSPLRLSGPDGEEAGEGDTVTVTGAEADDVMTTCQVGPVFRAATVELGG